MEGAGILRVLATFCGLILALTSSAGLAMDIAFWNAFRGFSCREDHHVYAMGVDIVNKCSRPNAFRYVPHKVTSCSPVTWVNFAEGDSECSGESTTAEVFNGCRNLTEDSVQLNCESVPDNLVAFIEFFEDGCGVNGRPYAYRETMLAFVDKCNIGSAGGSYKLTVINETTVILSEYNQTYTCEGASVSHTLEVNNCQRINTFLVMSSTRYTAEAIARIVPAKEGIILGNDGDTNNGQGSTAMGKSASVGILLICLIAWLMVAV